MKLNFDHIHRGCLFLLFALLSSATAFAQTSVSGTITDAESGDPLIGASILVTGTSTGTVTDFDGAFTLNVPEGAESLTISYTGYATQTVPFTGQTTLDLQMTSGELLDEVVVVGYGTVTQKQVTSAVTSIDSEDFNAGNINDPSQLIQGKVAGLTISKPGGNVNGGSTIRLRGLSSFGGNQSPLVIIDGVVGADLNTVDPADIESINVLKDGSAAAIYGIQASAGVIIITTKRGRSGDAVIDYRGYVTAENIAKAPPVADRETYLSELERVGDLFRSRSDNPEDLSTGAEVRAANDFGGETDWIDEVTRTGISHVHNLSYSGGSGNTTFRASANYRDIKGIGVVNDGFRQLNGRVNFNQKALNDRLTLTLDVTATDRDASIFNPAAYRYAITYNPTAPVFADQGGFNVPESISSPSNTGYGGFFEINNFDYFNPVAIARLTRRNEQTTTVLYSFSANYDLLPNWSAKVAYSRNHSQRVGTSTASQSSLFAGQANPQGNPLTAGFAQRYSSDNRNDLFEATTTYDVDLGTNSLELLAGYSWQEYNNQDFSSGGFGTVSDAFGANNLGQLTAIGLGTVQTGSGRGQYRVIGFFGRARLGIGTAYNLTASVRRDGTSRNSLDNQYDWFPAVSASADVVDALALTGPDELKVRVGYGITGSLPPNNYDYLQRFNSVGQYPQGGAYNVAVGPISNSNENLQFEKKGELNVGLDFAFLDYRLTGTVDYFMRRTKNLLVTAEVPSPPFLIPTIQANLNNADLVNNGIELSLGYSIDFSETASWQPRLTFSSINTRLEDNGEEPDFSFNNNQEIQSTTPGSPGQNGDPISRLVFGADFGGLYTRQLDVDATLASNSNNYVFLNEEEKVLVGNGLPDFSLGFANSFTFGQADLSFFLRGDFGHDLANLSRNFYGQAGNLSSRPIDNLVITDLYQPNITAAPKFSDYFIEDASFLALDNAQIGYTFNIAGESGFRNVRLYVAGQNLFYITNYTGVDPNIRFFDDVNGNGFVDGGESTLSPGIDRRSTFFRTRSFTFGANVGF
ncbi:iron complex outermembrane receptor protein [Lewinella aquimaris]|uniref:Iron complex outermembrane receptor protein n=1 Tax=Neolewinella aquimaris TaxID=1835722 RepID=A0A840E489_9BACT|nr:SusC/RagA family TonB-linked outer membrane protein [Neolewinella aquimaris]MBB4077917.1 iron complex outermembrane receptor protein [Neolewinella aquimaris]